MNYSCSIGKWRIFGHSTFLVAPNHTRIFNEWLRRSIGVKLCQSMLANHSYANESIQNHQIDSLINLQLHLDNLSSFFVGECMVHIYGSTFSGRKPFSDCNLRQQPPKWNWFLSAVDITDEHTGFVVIPCVRLEWINNNFNYAQFSNYDAWD